MRLIVFLCVLAGAAAHADAEFQPFTTLTPTGNVEMAQRFAAYLNSHQGCAPVNNGPRVILTGFGLWGGLTLSYSGYVIDNLSSPAFWPEGAAKPAPAKGYKIKDGVLGANEGARVVNRALRLSDGREVSACLIVVDVTWDFGGAVVATEMERFQPDAVIMSGIGGQATIEGGAENLTSKMEGYYASGAPDELNFPVSSEILPNNSAGGTIPMTWNVDRIAKAVRPFEPNVSVHHEADLSNNYICNNISYIALQAAAGKELKLADGLITLKPAVHSKPRVGFYHYDGNTGGDLPTLIKNSRMLLAMVKAAL